MSYPAEEETDRLHDEIDRLRAQLAKLVEAARAVVISRSGEEDWNRLCAVLAEIEREK